MSKECPTCHALNPDAADRCACGHDLGAVDRGVAAPRAPGPIWWAIVILGFLATGAATSFLPLIGVAVFTVVAVVAILGAQRLDGLPAVKALAMALAANAFVLGHSAFFFSFPRGFSVRPMLWAGEVFLVSLVTVVSVAALGLRAFRRERRLLLPAASLALAIEAYFLGWQLLGLAARLLDLKIAKD